ncbi:hypothetical protein CFIMG_007421RA00001 [Ceratocystis fimbriata CBS 114723]|uniref:Uncharacterized protein n=1 Tax=Ceratocystis fimbriata CBS 114723 TaxID=1035309 RepID=A0A2C5WXF9_9PEZI|nr:hypothetical protein CFIMG_007421RA00001 [Ceratocystis fimbriata CBS 114723]
MATLAPVILEAPAVTGTPVGPAPRPEEAAAPEGPAAGASGAPGATGELDSTGTPGLDGRVGLDGDAVAGGVDTASRVGGSRDQVDNIIVGVEVNDGDGSSGGQSLGSVRGNVRNRGGGDGVVGTRSAGASGDRASGGSASRGSAGGRSASRDRGNTSGDRGNTSGLARNNGGGSDGDGGVDGQLGLLDNLQDGNDLVNTADNAGQSLLDLVIVLTVGVDAVVDVLDELSVGAVAAGIGVTRAGNSVHPGVQARGDQLRVVNLGASRRSGNGGRRRDQLGGGDDGGSVADAGGDTSGDNGNLRGNNLGDGGGGRADRGDSGNTVGRDGGNDGHGVGLGGGGNAGLSDGADSGAQDDGVSDDQDGSLLSSGAVSDGGSARGDGLDLGSEDGRGLHVLSGAGGGLDRARGGSGSSNGNAGGLADSGSLAVAVEGDLGDLDLAVAGRLVRLAGVDDTDVLGTTALVVRNRGTVLGAGRAGLAVAAVGHVEVELQVAVKLGLDVEGLDGELLDSGAVAANLRSGLLLAAAATSDGLAGVETGLASETLELEAVVRLDLTDGHVVPLEATLLGFSALVVAVGGSGVLLVTTEGGRGLTEEGGGDRNNSSSFHLNVV